MPPSNVLAEVYRVLLDAAKRAREEKAAEGAGSAAKGEEA